MWKFLFLVAGLGFGWIPLQAQNLIYNRQERDRLDRQYTSALFRGGDAYMLAPADEPASASYFSIFAYLQGRVPGLSIGNVFGMVPWVRFRYARPAFFLDEMPVDAALLNDIPIQDVALIKIFRPPFLGAPGNALGGAIAVYTRQGDE